MDIASGPKVNNSATTTSTTTTTTTTEPPEVDDDYLSTQSAVRRNHGYNYYDYYNHAPTTNSYYGFGYNGYRGGGISAEVEYDEMPTVAQRQRQRFNQRAQRITTTTTNAPTTTKMATTPETTEFDDDITSGPISGNSGTTVSGTYHGYCFCSPLSTCPFGSVPRGGMCSNFFTYFTNMKFLRCCYRPSVARSFQL